MFTRWDQTRARRWLWALAWLAGLVALDGGLRSATPPLARAAWPASGSELGAGRLVFQASGRIPMPAGVPAAHASSLWPQPAGQAAALLACWFAGTRESGPDVQIVCSRFDRAQQRWSEAWVAVNRQAAGAGLGFGLRRLGNPVVWRDVQGRHHLFVVATGLGGWAAGRILHLREVAGAEPNAPPAFESLRVLPLSWLWNISHLVRAMPLPLRDGGMVLPAYFELGKKYPVALRFDAQGDFRGMVRMSQRGDQLQPTLLARSETDWLALLRDNSAERKLHAVRTQDGGRHWQDLPDPGLANPDAAVAGLALQPGRLFMAHNPRPESREQLMLSASADGLHWSPVQMLAEGGARSEFSYPSMAWADGSLWISYTEQRQAIAWQRFAFEPR